MGKIEVGTVGRHVQGLDRAGMWLQMDEAKKTIDTLGHLLIYWRTNELLVDEPRNMTWTAMKCDHCHGKLLYHYGSADWDARTKKIKSKHDCSFLVEARLDKPCDAKRRKALREATKDQPIEQFTLTI